MHSAAAFRTYTCSPRVRTICRTPPAFPAHDLWSAFIVWYLEVALYAFVFRWRLWPPE